MRLMERAAFLASLTACADDARGGEGRLVFLAGEAGVGKTTLLDCSRAAARRAVALGRCDGLFTPRPLGPLFDIAPQLGGPLAAACAAGEPRDRLFRLLLEALTTSPTYTVLVVEDAHWADEATPDLIRFLARRLRDARVLLVVSYRDEGLPAKHPLRPTLGDLQPPGRCGGSRCRRCRPPPSRSSPRAPVDADRLYALTGGNPFFVSEVLGVPGVPR